jgi:uncharacterized membrane protein YciS (DUF1049 family)
MERHSLNNFIASAKTSPLLSRLSYFSSLGRCNQYSKVLLTDTLCNIILGKSLALTIIIAVIIPGVGHIYLGYKKRGIIILIARIAIWLAVIWLVPFPFGWVIGPVLGGGFWIWQLIDVVRLYNKMKSGQTQTTEFKK